MIGVHGVPGGLYSPGITRVSGVHGVLGVSSALGVPGGLYSPGVTRVLGVPGVPALRVPRGLYSPGASNDAGGTPTPCKSIKTAVDSFLNETMDDTIYHMRGLNRKY